MSVKRSNPPLHLTRTPLIYVVAQVRFSAVISMDKYVPDLQEKLRHQYPWFQHGKVQELAFQAQGAPNVTFSDRYEFLQRDKRTGLVLTSSSFALHTNQYSDYDSFEEEFSASLAALDEIVDLAIVERVGLRYVDLVRLGSGENWSHYINPGLLGLNTSEVGVTQLSSQYISVGKTDLGMLAFRYTQSESPMPPDLIPIALKFEAELLRPKEVGTILDFDHYSELTYDFDLTITVDTIGGLHDNLDRAFRSAVTLFALKKWE